jgi:hypothetical protein
VWRAVDHTVWTTARHLGAIMHLLSWELLGDHTIEKKRACTVAGNPFNYVWVFCLFISHTHARAHTPAHTHAYTHTYTQIYGFVHALRESVTYCVCLAKKTRCCSMYSGKYVVISPTHYRNGEDTSGTSSWLLHDYNEKLSSEFLVLPSLPALYHINFVINLI